MIHLLELSDFVCDTQLLLFPTQLRPASYFSLFRFLSSTLMNV